MRRSMGAFLDALWLQPRRWEEEFFQDIRYGIRGPLKNPGFAAVALLTLALGIGANTAIFSVLRAVVLRPLPYDDPDRIYRITWEGNAFSASELDVWLERTRVFENMATAWNRPFLLSGVEEPERVWAQTVSGDCFSLIIH